MTTTAGSRTTAAHAMMRGALWPTLGAGVVASGVGAAVAGRTGLLGAALGTVLVTAVFTLALVVLGGARRVDPWLTLVLALALYVAQVAGLAITFVVLSQTGLLGDPFDRTALGVTVIVCTLVWSVAQVVASVRHREPLYDLGETS